VEIFQKIENDPKLIFKYMFFVHIHVLYKDVCIRNYRPINLNKDVLIYSVYVGAENVFISSKGIN
jgi:hypothetical protein